MKRALALLLVGLTVLTGATSGMTVVSPSTPVADDTSPAVDASDASVPGAGVSAAGVSAASVSDASVSDASAPGANRLGVNASALQAPVTGQPNATNALRIPADELEATRFDVVTLSVGGGVAMDNRRIHTRYAVHEFEAQFAAAETDAERRAALREAAGTIDARLVQLQREAETARQQFNDGGSSRVYLRTLGELHAEAAALDSYIRSVSQRAARVPETEIETELSSARTELRRFDGPVRETVAATLRGEENRTRVYVATSADSVVLATIVDGEYLREAYRGSARQASGPRAVTLTEAGAIVEESYPWAWENQQSLTAQSTSSAAVFSFQLQTPQGQLRAYVDARSERIYRETQRQPLSTRYLRQQTATQDGIRLSVNRSYGGGPMQIRLTESQTGEPINGTVRINDESVGEVGADGTLWVVAPYRTDNVTVSTVRDGARVSVSVGG